MKPSTVKPVNLVLDCDEVLVYITPLWVEMIHDSSSIFKEYFKLKSNFDISKHSMEVLLRDAYYLVDWLIKDEYKDNSEIKQQLVDRVMKLYSHPNFYDNLVPTRMGNGLAMLGTQSFVDNIYIVTKSVDANKESKENFLKNLFKGIENKLKIIHVPVDGKKSDIVKDIPNVGVIAEDELGNIIDYLDNCDNITKCDFYIPRLGYNQATAELYEKASQKEINLMYYDFR